MPIEAGFASIEFLGLDFVAADTDQALAALARAPADAPFAYAVTPNVDHMVRLTGAAGDPELWDAYRSADLVLCDSRILAALARLRGVRLPVAPGSDLTAALLERVAVPADAVTIVGGDRDAAAQLQSRFPQLHFRQHIPPMGLRNNPKAMAEAAAFVAAHPARFTLLAVGSPQQELLARLIKGRGEAKGIGLCVGASIDFLTGRARRAPALLRKLSLEWAYRLASDPRRLWRRYLLEGPRIFLAVARWKREL